MIILSERQIVLLHDHLIHETGGTPGLRDEALLQSALAAPFQSFSGMSSHRFSKKLQDWHTVLSATIRLSMGTSGSAHTPCWSFLN